jgi:hypothetical protein
MRLTHPIRRWRRIGLSSLLCVAVHSLAIAQTQTPTPPKKPANASAASSKVHSASGQAASKSDWARSSTRTSSHKPVHASSRTSAQTATHTASQKSKSSHGKKGSRQVAERVKKKRGQQGIDSARAREIQQALIREHYLEGEPTGTWDRATQAAMQRYQADQGWQTKTTPDSRALIKLGLGPSDDRLLNPGSAMTPKTTTMTTTAPTAPAAGDPKAGASQTPPEDNLPQQ